MQKILSLFHKIKLHHILFWSVYFVIWIRIYADFYKDLSDLYKVTGVYALAHAVIFYLTQYLLFPNLLKKRKVMYFILAFLGLLLLTTALMFVSILLILDIPFSGSDKIVSTLPFLIGMFASNIFMPSVLISIKAMLDYIRGQRKAQKLENQRLESELQYLKSQVNPHFLFNTINSVYVLIRQDPELASATLIKLSDLLRAQLYDFSSNFVPVEKEMEYLNNYIDLEKIRKGNRVQVIAEKDHQLSGFQIAPFVLLAFLENCFKHVSSQTGQHQLISFSAKREQDHFYARFYNTTDPNEDKNAGKQGGIGLQNVKRRLELLYPGKHDLSINEQPESFEVLLSLKIV